MWRWLFTPHVQQKRSMKSAQLQNLSSEPSAGSHRSKLTVTTVGWALPSIVPRLCIPEGPLVKGTYFAGVGSNSSNQMRHLLSFLWTAEQGELRCCRSAAYRWLCKTVPLGCYARIIFFLNFSRNAPKIYTFIINICLYNKIHVLLKCCKASMLPRIRFLRRHQRIVEKDVLYGNYPLLLGKLYKRVCWNAGFFYLLFNRGANQPKQLMLFLRLYRT